MPKKTSDIAPEATSAVKASSKTTRAPRKAGAAKPARSSTAALKLKASLGVEEAVPLGEGSSLPLPRDKARKGMAHSALAFASVESKEATAPAPKSLRDELVELLSESLRISVEDGDFTDPNNRTLKLFLGNKCISRTSFNIRSRREYEG